MGLFFRETVRGLYEVLAREWKDGPLVDDAIQHAFKRFIEDPFSITAHNMRELRGWHLTVARNHLRDQAKVGDGKWTRPISEFDRSLESGQEDQDFLGNTPDDAQTIEDMIEYEDRSDVMWSLLSELGSPCREILSLYYLDSLGLAEVARRIGLTLDQVKKRKPACLAQVREMAKTREILRVSDM